jgi:uncharacterized protein
MKSYRVAKLLATAILVIWTATAQAAATVTGAWLGTLDTGAMKLRLAFHITTGADGQLGGTVDSLDQGAMGLPLTSVVLEAPKIRIELKSIGGVFEGVVNEDAKEITGTWKQGPMSLPLVLHPADAAALTLHRPQKPTMPYPYDEIEVSYAGSASNVQLSGTLTMPRSKAPHPAVLLLTGSGVHDRNESLFGHQPFLVLSDYLTRKGIAVLRMDDRGAGKSTGNKMLSTTDDFAKDALLGVSYLRSRDDIDARKVGLIGHSEGGITAPLAAASSPDVAFIVLLAGPGVPLTELLKRQGQLISKAMGLSEDVIAFNVMTQGEALAIVKTVPDNATASTKLHALRDQRMGALESTTLSQQDKERVLAGRAAFDAQISMMLTPWFRQLVAYDPRPALMKVHCPVLALNGSLDLQVAADQNLPAIRSALQDGGNRDFAIRELPGLNHLFQAANTGAPSEYGTIEETIDPAALEAINTWIQQHTRSATPQPSPRHS